MAIISPKDLVTFKQAHPCVNQAVMPLDPINPRQVPFVTLSQDSKTTSSRQMFYTTYDSCDVTLG